MGEYIQSPVVSGEKYGIGYNITLHALHHQSFKALWETKWQKPCSMGVYPFMFGSIEDFQPVADNLIANNVQAPYDWDAYAEEYFPIAEHLVDAASLAEHDHATEKAAEFLLRASALYRIARFPIPRSPKQRLAWAKGKEIFLRGQRLLENPIRQVDVPHTHGLAHEGNSIPVFELLPSTATAINPVPTVIIYTGLDGYRTELSIWAEGWRKRNVGVIILEIPGTGDSPADRDDPTSPDRQMSSLLDWCDVQPGIDSRKLVLWGFSTGGMYATRAAHTHKERLTGVINLGGGCHHMFDKEWLNEVDHLEYPFDLAGSLAYKFGYGSDVVKFKEEAASKFSLLNDGTLDRPCTRLLLVNGIDDEIFPIEDMNLLLHHGPSPKEARFIPHAKHMGEPTSFGICLQWIYDLFGIKGDVTEQLRELRLPVKYHLNRDEGEDKEKADEGILQGVRAIQGIEDLTKPALVENLPQQPPQWEVEISA